MVNLLGDDLAMPPYSAPVRRYRSRLLKWSRLVVEQIAYVPSCWL